MTDDTNEPGVAVGDDPGDDRPAEAETSLGKPSTETGPREIFPIVGIGASAGGLEAFERFFSNMPANSGMAFVVVQHLSPPTKSILDDLIGRFTEMGVSEVVDGVEVKPDNIYIIPPGKDMALLHGRLQLLEPVQEGAVRLPIDFFFRSLAEDQKDRAIGVVLSGTGSDGALGIRSIKEKHGLVMVQDPKTADYDGMPWAAVASGLADYVLPPEAMPRNLVNYIDKALPGPHGDDPQAPAATGDALRKVFVLLRAQTGHDFTGYKLSTIRRRVERRMVVNQIDDLDHYLRFLRQNPNELESLFREFLITVTGFFRDTMAFTALEEKIIPQILDRPTNRPIRVWVPGCATGEEAYSIAILLHEQMKARKVSFKTQIFATDIDGDAIEAARAGIYPLGAAADIQPDRLTRYFSQGESSYRINESIRPWLIFAEQNALSDPPFSRVDLISCRNLLIYLDAELQKRVLTVFHYALQPGGFLFLGHSETVGGFADEFETVDAKWKIHQRRETASAVYPEMRHRSFSITPDPKVSPTPRRTIADRSPSYRDIAEQALLEHFAPAGAVVNEHGDVLYFHGRTGKYLEPASGEATLNIVRMAREGLKLELTMGLRKAIDRKKPVSYRGLKITEDDEQHVVDLTIRRLTVPPDMPTLLMVAFQEVAGPEPPLLDHPAAPPDGDGAQTIAELERELRSKEEYLQTTIEDLQSSNEEMQSANEELQSANEELQSSNEELETSKEELQSLNEELVTVNAEVQEKITELTRVNNDMANLLAGTGIGTIFLDEHLKIRLFTPEATNVINLIDSDIGRPASHIASTLFDHDELTRQVRQVLDSLVPHQSEIQSVDKKWYQMRILPYRTLENTIEGVVLTFVDISELKRAEHEISTARDFAEQLLETVREPLVTLDAKLRVVAANRSFYQTFDFDPEFTEGQQFYKLGERHWDIPELRDLLEKILPQETIFEGFHVDHEFPGFGHRRFILNARQVRRGPDDQPLILLAIEDIGAKEESRDK